MDDKSKAGTAPSVRVANTAAVTTTATIENQRPVRVDLRLRRGSVERRVFLTIVFIVVKVLPEAYTVAMSDQPPIPIIIGALVGVLVAAGGAFYVFVFSQIPGARWIQVIVVTATVLVLGAVTAVVRERLKEINEEDPDDYRKY